MATSEEGICTIDITTGTDMQVTITYNDGVPDISRSFPVAGIFEPSHENFRKGNLAFGGQ